MYWHTNNFLFIYGILFWDDLWINKMCIRDSQKQMQYIVCMCVCVCVCVCDYKNKYFHMKVTNLCLVFVADSTNSSLSSSETECIVCCGCWTKKKSANWMSNGKTALTINVHLNILTEIVLWQQEILVIIMNIDYEEGYINMLTYHCLIRQVQRHNKL